MPTQCNDKMYPNLQILQKEEKSKKQATIGKERSEEVQAARRSVGL
jgi:hypothetical protein